MSPFDAGEHKADGASYFGTLQALPHKFESRMGWKGSETQLGCALAGEHHKSDERSVNRRLSTTHKSRSYIAVTFLDRKFLVGAGCQMSTVGGISNVSLELEILYLT